MRKMLRLCCAALLIAGCAPGGGGDGAGPDTGLDMAPADDGGAADRGPDPDGGPDPDQGPAPDRGPIPDTGPRPADAGSDARPEDAGPAADAEIAEDSGPDARSADACVDCGGAPRILTFAANTPRLTAGGQIILTAVVTDPDGAADLLGGVLESTDGTPYGPFAAAAEVGTYSFTLSWDALDIVETIEFDGVGRRAVVAAFFDQAGNRTARPLELTLHCDGAGGAACGGACVSLETAEHCGACGAACDAICRDRACVCEDGLTRCDGACIETADDPANCGGCDIACEALPDGEGACRDGRCRVMCDPGFQLCDPAAPVCAPCPVDGVQRVTCDGDRCVAAACEPDHRMCDGACSACPGDEALDELCYGGRCVATLCGLETHPCAEGCCPWRSLDVGVAGQTFALAHDGEVHIALGDRQRVLYRRWIDEGWVDEIPLELDAPTPSPIAVQIARIDGVTHLVYGTIGQPRGDGSVASRIGYMRREAGVWREVSAVDGGEEIYHSPDLAVRGDTIRVAWAGRRIRVADPTRAPWVPDLAFEGSESDPRLTIAPDGTVHLVARELFGDMVYARQAPGGAFETVDHGTGLGGDAPAIGTDADGRPVLLHRTRNDGQLYTTRFDGMRWRTAATLPGFQALYGHDVFNGPDGHVVACLGTQLGLHLMHEAPDRAPAAREVANGDHFQCTFALAPDGGQHVLSAAGQTIYWFY